jgi:hypothetical protein
MATDKHTPGPWYAKYIGDRKPIGSNELIGVYQVNDGTRLIAEPLSEANARLIAAAPDLLEALLLAYAALDNLPGSIAHDLIGDHVFEAAEAAIAKAEGK